MKTPPDAKELNRIEKRAIEALAISPVIRAVAKRIGKDEAIAILHEVNQQEAFERGRCMAEEMGGNGMEELVDEVAGWGRGGIWEMDVLEQTPTTYFFNVTHCPYYEKYKELGLEAYGVGWVYYGRIERRVGAWDAPPVYLKPVYDAEGVVIYQVRLD